MQYTNEFRRPVSVDFAPQGSVCEWCGKPAEHKLTAIGGRCHNRGGLFCHSCGEQFVQAVINSLAATTTSQPFEVL
ncbi:MAG: hypothetical protein IMW89_09755 [Ktedonobacteraceae bacterium]|nr:hypothetical protein [Ktedonobacteraceae bacterium]